MYLKNIGKPKENPSGFMMMFTKPWFVIGIVVACFAILTPKIFLPLFRQLFGFGRSNQENENADLYNMQKMPPHLKMRHAHISPRKSGDSLESDYSRPGPNPQFGRSGPGPGSVSHQSGSSSKSLLTYLLPVYAIGIGVYMVYTLFKVFHKNGDNKKDKEDSDYEDNQPTTLKFRERNNNDPNFVWDANNGEFKMKTSHHFPRSEESEDEANNYERYKNLDPDYVAYLKERRRMKRDEQKKKSALAAKTASPFDKTSEIPLTSNTGLTSITNTNVLMNDTLERMKYQLNKINSQLMDIEQKGNPFEDPELEGLRLQLSQTELQMAKIMTIVNSVSGSAGKKSKCCCR